MSFHLKEINYENNITSFVFYQTSEEEIENLVEITFKFEWEHPKSFFDQHNKEIEIEKIGQAEKFLEGIVFETEEKQAQGIYDKLLSTTTAHIPNSETVMLFKEIMETWAKLKSCPFHIQELQHPRYPLLTVVYNQKVFSGMQELIDTVLVAIGNATITEFINKEMKEEEIESTEETTDIIIEHELDDEVAALIKQNKEPEMKDYKEAVLTYENGGSNDD